MIFFCLKSSIKCEWQNQRRRELDLTKINQRNEHGQNIYLACSLNLDYTDQPAGLNQDTHNQYLYFIHIRNRKKSHSSNSRLINLPWLIDNNWSMNEFIHSFIQFCAKICLQSKCLWENLAQTEIKANKQQITAEKFKLFSAVYNHICAVLKYSTLST